MLVVNGADTGPCGVGFMSPKSSDMSGTRLLAPACVEDIGPEYQDNDPFKARGWVRWPKLELTLVGILD